MNDREVYLKLATLADELAKDASEAETFVGQAALTSVAQTLAGTAKAIYEHALAGGEN